MKLVRFFLRFYAMPSADDLKREQLAQARRELTLASLTREEAVAHERMLQARVARLAKEVK